MAVVLLGANNTNDTSSTSINVAPNWTSSGNLYITAPGTVSLVKVKVSQNSAVQTTGGHTVELFNSDNEVIATGTFDAGTVPKGDPPAWYTINVTGSPSVVIDDRVYLNAQKDVSTGISLAWRKTATVYMLEVWGEEAAAPTKATTPAPANTATDVTLDQATLTWEDGGGADTYDVYYGTVSGNLTKISSAQAGTSLTVTGITNGSPYDYVVTRYWRIDSTNAAGTTTGDEWSFTTIDFDQLRVSYTLISEEEGGGIEGWTGYGPYDSPPGVEGIDFRYNGENNMITIRRLVAAANNKLWVEDI